MKDSSNALLSPALAGQMVTQEQLCEHSRWNAVIYRHSLVNNRTFNSQQQK